MLESAAKIGKYRIVERIGAGGMADVYEAEDTFLGRTVAMKVLPPEFARDPERIFRFEKEIRNLAALDHPNIVTIYDVGQDQGYHFYTMTLLPGGDLKQRIQQGLTPRRCLEIFKQIADALDYAHCKGLIHRDIKPQNILFDGQERPILTDLGIAKAIGSGSHMTKTGMIMGTPHYMSPEQARGQRADHRSDLYSLGVVFYEMLTGSVPYEAEDTFAVVVMHINNPIPKLPSSLNAYQFFIDHLMAKDPGDRFDDAFQLAETIEKFQRGARFASPDSTMEIATQTSSYWEDDGFSAFKQRPRSGSGGKKWLLPMGLALMILGAGYVLLKPNLPLFRHGAISGGKIDSTEASVETPNPIPVKTSPHAVTAPSGPSPAELALKNEIKRLLALAEQDRNADRLTTPVGNNAADRYKAVLGLESDNASARQGLVWIVNKYVAMNDGAVAREEFSKARKYLASAESVIPNADVIASARKRLKAAEKAKEERERITAEKAAEAEKERLAAEQEAAVEKERLAAQEAEAAEQKRLAEEQAEAARRAAFDGHMSTGLEALDDKDKAAALSAFEAALMLYPDDPLALSGLEQAQALNIPPKHGDTFTNSLDMTFIYLAGGSFTMGSPGSEPDRDADEQLHQVTLTNGYWMQTTEVTQGQWKKLMGANPSRFANCGDTCPVENVSWEDIQLFIRKINAGGDKVTYNLPTEAQWEYAARAGSLSRFFYGDMYATLGDYGWYDRNAGGKTHPVGQKRANAWGLHDLYGNVWEWCRDWYGSYPNADVADPAGPSAGRARVVRGGSWFSNNKMCRSAVRHSLSQDNRNFYLGFRLAAMQ